MPIIRGIKRRLHRDIVADPVLHGRVLNLYLNGEQYPHRVENYFPMAAVEDPALERRMREHLREEDKHVALYSKAIRELGQPVVELPMREIYNTVICRHTPPPDAAALIPADRGRLTLAHFLAHLHWLETRIAHSLEYHLDACAHACSPYPAKAVHAILADEREHVAYTREALMELVPRRTAHRVLAIHRRAESRANREFSARELRRLRDEEGVRIAPLRRALYAGSVALLQGATLHG